MYICIYIFTEEIESESFSNLKSKVNNFSSLTLRVNT